MMEYLLFVWAGALVPSTIIYSLTYFVARNLTRGAALVLACGIVTTSVAVGIGAFGLANGGPPAWSQSLTEFGPPPVLLMLIHFARQKFSKG